MSDIYIFLGIRIQEAHPLKQGLKQKTLSQILPKTIYSRGASTKTRIETSNTYLDRNHPADSRGASTKTRIETHEHAHDTRDAPNSRGASTKTRIETCRNFLGHSCYCIQEAHPLKQGLKPSISFPKGDDTSFKRRIH